MARLSALALLPYRCRRLSEASRDQTSLPYTVPSLSTTSVCWVSNVNRSYAGAPECGATTGTCAEARTDS
jgi:hypothetical protein